MIKETHPILIRRNDFDIGIWVLENSSLVLSHYVCHEAIVIIDKSVVEEDRSMSSYLVGERTNERIGAKIQRTGVEEDGGHQIG